MLGNFELIICNLLIHKIYVNRRPLEVIRLLLAMGRGKPKKGQKPEDERPQVFKDQKQKHLQNPFLQFLEGW
jgi:hypothetical protein